MWPSLTCSKGFLRTSKLSPKRHNYPLKRKLVQTELKGNFFVNQRVNISLSLCSWVSLNLIPRVAFLERNLYDLNIKMLVRRYDNRLTQFNRQLLFSIRLATLAERKVNMNQRRTESTLSLNRQSELQAEYKNDLRDGRRVDAVELIEKKLKKGRSRIIFVICLPLAMFDTDTSFEFFFKEMLLADI